MKLFDRIASRFGYEKTKRSFSAAMNSRLYSDWFASCTNADGEIRSGIKTMRSRCRDLERNNDYVRRYFKLLENNVLGADGVRLQMKVKEVQLRNGVEVETYDQRANRIIEYHWQRWSRREFCTLGRNLTWLDVQRLALRSTARDGSILFQLHWDTNSPYVLRLEPMESDHLDTDFNATLPGGGVIRLGVEYDGKGQKVAYHLLKHHPGELYQPQGYDKERFRERIPASRVLHLYMPERVGQSDGFPWLASSIPGLKHLGSYIESEVVAARVSAAKMGFLVPQANAAGAGYAGATTPSGNKYMEVEPGSIEQLPYGYSFQSFDPNHPNSAFKDFLKAVLRSISSGLGVSYASLANDLESVNYSSIRAGLIDEREEWKAVQAWFINWFVSPIFEQWLEFSLVKGSLKDEGSALPNTKFNKFNSPEWKPRRWGWVDPLKDIQATALAIDRGLTSRRSAVAEMGADIEDVMSEQAADKELEENYDLDFSEEKTVDTEDKANGSTNGKSNGVQPEDDTEDD